MRVVHISDTHFGTERPRAVSELLNLVQGLQPQAIIWSGDITQRATPEQFRRARSFAEALPPAPLVVLPGNHDVPLFDVIERLWRPFARFQTAFEGPIEPQLDLPGLQITTVNTARRWRQQHGALSKRQIDRVARRLLAAPAEAWRLVVTHHPLVVDREDDLSDRPLRHRTALRRWHGAGVDVLLGGHTHVPFIERAEGPDAPWIVQGGTAVSARLRHGWPNSLNVLTQQGHDGGLTRAVERWDFDDALHRFVDRQRVVLD